MKCILEFAGGLELLFKRNKVAEVEFPDVTEVPILDLIRHVSMNIIEERKEMFTQGDSVRPGILVLINDVDWALKGEETYVVQDNDRVCFISTLHGG